MKATVTCDDVFEVLTRGPFPTGAADDEAVEIHLTGCHECRQLAEALRPAVSLFHEVIDDASDPLPAYRGRLENQPRLELCPPERNFWQDDSLWELPLVSRRQPTAWGLSAEAAANCVRFASAALLGVALCLIVWTFSSTVGQHATSTRSANLATYSTGPLRLGSRTVLALAAIPRPDVCRSEPVVIPVPDEVDSSPAPSVAVASVGQACCTRCHSAAHPGVACSLVWQADCQTCHKSGPPARLATRDVSLHQTTCQVCHDG